MSLAGKNILITGGSRGIGAGIARLLACRGARVGLTYAGSEAAAQEVLESLEGSGHQVWQLNVADEASVNECIKKALECFGNLDGLVNNAGITRDQLLLRMKAEDFDQVVQTNLRGSFLCTKAVMKSMMKARKGSVVNITSVIGHSGNAGQANYAASKAGMEAFARSVAQELGSRGVRVNNVAPGFIKTDMTDQLPEEQKKAILDKVPLQKFGEVEDVAQAVAFLLSDESQYITGQTLHVNGGMLM